MSKKSLRYFKYMQKFISVDTSDTNFSDAIPNI